MSISTNAILVLANTCCRAEPISVYIYDDWSRISSDIPAEERRVTLDFLVTGTDVLAIMTVGTVPKLVSYVNKFRMNLEAQREGAARESRAFRLANAPKPDNPLSAVANAMFQSAKSRLKENETGLSYAIGQRMSLKLKLLRLIVLPRSMRDPELARFVGEDIHARLHRFIQSEDEPARRDLQPNEPPRPSPRPSEIQRCPRISRPKSFQDALERVAGRSSKRG